MTSDVAAELLRGYAPPGTPLADAWKSARRATHPDRHDGDQTRWDAVEEAAVILGLTA
jgi:hypothetical protein